MSFKKTYNNKTVFITGNTGFKGAWLTIWLISIGASVIGYSNKEKTSPSLYNEAKLFKKIKQYYGDIKNVNKINLIINNYKPDFIFHLAAQPIVSKSYEDPYKNFVTNVLGTISILQSLKNYNKKLIAIFVTSDKVYKNIEKNSGYIENDILGGLDPYSASKAMAELSINSYFNSFLKNNKKIRIAVGRAGNVIGGGDWSPNRVVPDCIKSWSNNKKVSIRSPHSTRPWQHVLEPLSGYLTLGCNLFKNNKINGEAFNFGPQINNNFDVITLIMEMQNYWKNNRGIKVNKSPKLFKEANLLELNCLKAKKFLNWQAALPFKEAAFFTVDWYNQFYNTRSFNAYLFSLKQIREYEKLIN